MPSPKKPAGKAAKKPAAEADSTTFVIHIDTKFGPGFDRLPKEIARLERLVALLRQARGLKVPGAKQLSGLLKETRELKRRAR